MIYVCEEFRNKANSPSVLKMIKYLGKTNQDLVIRPRKSKDNSPKAGTTKAHVRQVNGTAANVKVNGRSPKHQRKLCSLPNSNYFKWSRDLTLQIKRYLVDCGLSIHSLVRVGDLGLRSPRETVPIGVILKASYNLSNQTRVDKRDVLCYALSYTGYAEILADNQLISNYQADWILYTDQFGNWQLITWY